MRETALKYLKMDEVLHIGMIFAINNGLADIIYAGPDGVFIREITGGVTMLSTDTFEKAAQLLDEAGKQAHICIYRKDAADYHYEKYCHAKYVENRSAAYIKNRPVNTGFAVNLAPLNVFHSDWVYEHYSDQLSYAYIKSRLEQNAVYGGSIDGQLFGFVGVHEEGSLGILKVLEPFRGRGLGFALAGSMVNILLDKGHTPFAQIEKDNEASLGLHKKLGFELSERTLFRLID